MIYEITIEDIDKLDWLLDEPRKWTQNGWGILGGGFRSSPPTCRCFISATRKVVGIDMIKDHFVYADYDDAAKARFLGLAYLAKESIKDLFSDDTYIDSEDLPEDFCIYWNDREERTFEDIRMVIEHMRQIVQSNA